MVTEPRRIVAVSLAHRVAEERGCPPPGAVGSSVGYMVCNDRWGYLPSCQIIYMTIVILMKMLVSDRGGAAVAAEDVNDDGLPYDNDDNDVDDKDSSAVTAVVAVVAAAASRRIVAAIPS